MFNSLKKSFHIGYFIRFSDLIDSEINVAYKIAYDQTNFKLFDIALSQNTKKHLQNLKPSLPKI